MSQVTPEIKAEFLKLHKQRSHLADFAEAILEATPAAHHRLICKYIDDLLDDQYDELIINTPPGAAKSAYTSRALPAYFLGKYPKAHILTVSYSVELAEKWGRWVRNKITEPVFKRVFPKTTLSQDSKSAGRWATAQGGEFYAAGAGSGILGFRADLAVIDDPVSGFEEAQSITRLTSLHEWYETDFVTRLKPGAKVILICQRLARNDLAGYMIDRNIKNPTKRQRVLKLPMIALEDDPLGRAVGEQLWPEWFDEAMVKDAQRDEYKWRTLYQQEPPADEGAWVAPGEIKYAPTPEIGDEYSYYIVTDLALSVNKGDYTVLIAAAHHRQSGSVHIVDMFRKRVDPNVSSQALISMCQVYKPVEVLCDDDNASKVWGQLVATQARESKVAVPWRPMKIMGQDKETRAASLRGMFKRGLIHFDKDKPWTSAIINEVMQFPNALGMGVDDCIDALSLLGRRLSAMAAPHSPAAAKTPPKTIYDATLNELWEDREKSLSLSGRRRV